MGTYDTPISLYLCNDSNLKKPNELQNWKLTWHKNLRLWARDECLQENIFVDFCRHDERSDHQKWKYDINTKQLESFWENKWCLTADIDREKKLFTRPCNASDMSQKWTWGNVNETALKNFENINWDYESHELVTSNIISTTRETSGD